MAEEDTREVPSAPFAEAAGASGDRAPRAPDAEAVSGRGSASSSSSEDGPSSQGTSSGSPSSDGASSGSLSSPGSASSPGRLFSAAARGDDPGTSTGGGRRDRNWNHVGDLRRARPAFVFACIAWPIFTVFDVGYFLLGGVGDPVLNLAFRALPVPFFVAAYLRVRRRPPISEREFVVIVYAALYAIVIALELQCVVTGGLRSPYAFAHFAVLAATTMVPRPWRSHAPRMIPLMFFYPLAMLIGGLVYPPMRGQLEDGEALRWMGGNCILLVTTMSIVILGSHRNWALRREVFEARSIGRYELRRRIGKGGMGEVWAAWHRGLEKEVALKILKLSDDDDEAAIARFEREVRLCSGLTHAHTVRVFDSGTTEDGLLYYAMELLDGESLAELVRREGALPPARVVHLLLGAARALAEAHERGIVHRDVKAENLFVSSAGGEGDFVKVLDFGIARAHEAGTQLTRTGAVAGTPSTMSPEVIEGGEASPASDVYAMGVVAYFMLTGRLPFAGEAPSQTLLAHLGERPIPPSQRVATPIPPDLERIVLRCLEKKPSDRYPDGRRLADALSECSAAGAWTPAPVTSPGAPRPASVAPPPSRTQVETAPSVRPPPPDGGPASTRVDTPGRRAG